MSTLTSNLDLRNILFFDIETVSEYQNYTEMPEHFQKLWTIKAKNLSRELELDKDQSAHWYNSKAGIFAEFSKVVCISMGYLRKENDAWVLRLKSISGHDELELLKEFSQVLDKNYDQADKSLICGHNIKEFDVPFLCRRMVKHNLPLPAILDVAGKKPWEIKQFIDTLELWKFGDMKNFTSLNLLAAVLDVPTPKDDIDGSMVGQVYWEENDLDRIAVYCQKDVATVVQVLFRLSGMPILSPDQIQIL